MVNSRGIFMGYSPLKIAAWSKKHGGLREHHLTLDFCVVKAWCTTPFCLASCKNHPGKSPSLCQAELSAKWFDGDIGKVWATSWACLKAQLQPFSPLASWTAHVELLAGSSRALTKLLRDTIIYSSVEQPQVNQCVKLFGLFGLEHAFSTLWQPTLVVHDFKQPMFLLSSTGSVFPPKPRPWALPCSMEWGSIPWCFGNPKCRHSKRSSNKS